MRDHTHHWTIIPASKDNPKVPYLTWQDAPICLALIGLFSMAGAYRFLRKTWGL